MSLEVKTLSAHRRHLDMLAEAYERIYTPAFPDANERESLEKLRRSLRGETPGVEAIVNIMGEKLDHPTRRKITGISVAYYYPDQQVGHLSHNAIDPSLRGGGLGKLMVESRIHALKRAAARHGKTLKGAFIEINDPAKVKPEHDSIDPATRAAIFEKFGARRIPVDYTQPALSETTAPCDYLMLMSYPVDGHYADKSTVEGMVRGVYAHYQPGLELDDTPYFQRFKAQLDAWAYDLPTEPVEPGYAKGLPEHTKTHNHVKPLESVRFWYSDFRLALSRRPGAKPTRSRTP